MTTDDRGVDAARVRSTFRRLTPERHPILAQCAEFEDGDVMWEDDVLYRGDRAGWRADYLSRAGWLMQHIRYGQTHRPRLTHLLLTAVRRAPAEEGSRALDISGVHP